MYRHIMYETYEIIRIDSGYYEDYNLVEIKNDVGLNSNIILQKGGYNIGDKLTITLTPSSKYLGVCDDLRAI